MGMEGMTKAQVIKALGDAQKRIEKLEGDNTGLTEDIEALKGKLAEIEEREQESRETPEQSDDWDDWD